MDEAVSRVVAVTLRRYPRLDVPYHSRWRHFSVGGVERAREIALGVAGEEMARAKLDAAIIAVLLDAGAGPQWRFREDQTGQVLSRSEGLAVASLRAMQQGLFSSDAGCPWRADGEKLMTLAPRDLAPAFQHRRGNELVGLESRADLLRRLGVVVSARPEIFGKSARLGHLYDYWLSTRQSPGEPLPAPEILSTLLHVLGPIWPSRIQLGGVFLGDCGRHRLIPGQHILPFHKLSQWLVYSLVEPLQEAGVRITDVNGLTGLAEYRNGGLFIDCGVLVPRNPDLLRGRHKAASEVVNEWRALTVSLLDELAELVRERLGVSESEYPLPAVLEGGSWAAGRELAFALRPDGSSPINVISDGTRF